MKYNAFLLTITIVCILTTIVSCEYEAQTILEKRVEHSLIKSSQLLKEQAHYTISSCQPLFHKVPKIGRVLNNEIKSVTARIDSVISVLKTDISKEDENDARTNTILELEKYVHQRYDSILIYTAPWAKLTRKEILERSNSFKIKTKSAFFEGPITNEETNLAIQQQINELRILENIFVDAVGMLIPARTPSYTRYYPIIVPESKTIKKGDSFKAEILIGNFIINEMYQYSLKINGEIHEFKDGKLIFEKDENGKIGENKLDLELDIIMPFTGEKLTTKSEFVYHIVE